MPHSVRPCIRSAVPSEAEQLTELALRAKASWGYSEQWLASKIDELTISSAYIRKHRVLVAELGGICLGTAALEDHGDRWRLEHVWIEPAMQRQGHGRALVSHALELAGSLRPGRVELHADPNARLFYERMGGKVEGYIPAPTEGDPMRELPIMCFLVGTTAS
jgi:ribosomal protein S18 acetylase RimI-like enzyme